MNRSIVRLCLVCLLIQGMSDVFAADREQPVRSGSADLPAKVRGARLTPVPVSQVTIDDSFWSPLRKVWREVTINDCFDKFENDRGGAINNFDRVRDGKTGGHAGPQWYDGLIYEMIRGAADFLIEHPDPQLEKRLDGYIERIAAAQARDPDGYLNTWTQLMEPNHRWGLNGGNDIDQHDLYNLGALIEAGVHYYRATGKTTLLNVAVKMTNYACDGIGAPPRANMVPGHALPEESLASLYSLFVERPDLKRQMTVPVDEKRWRELGEFFIENRGNHTGRRDFGSYDQDHLPVFQQPTLEGHAVRATLMGAGLTALGMLNNREEYSGSAQRLWNNMITRRMYLNGGVGASREGEAFTRDYDLPNDGYLETCAAIGSGFFSQNMNQAFGEARFADELERTLYNATLAGVSLKGDRYFYENPLEAGRNRARWSWHPCPCCPPMFLKIMGAMPGYIYMRDEKGIYVNLFAGSSARVKTPNGEVQLRQTTRYPWTGDVSIEIGKSNWDEFDLCLRIPGWLQGETSSEDLYEILDRPRSNAFQLRLNGELIESPSIERGYVRLHRKWQAGDRVTLSMEMQPRRVRANPNVEADLGKIALMRGPIVYCLEGLDNGRHVTNVVLPGESKLSDSFRPDLFGGVTVIEAKGLSLHRGKDGRVHQSSVNLTAIPYGMNANRDQTEMTVWLPETRDRVRPLPTPTLATEARPTASHCNPSDTVTALNDGIEPASSDDLKISRFTWWDHRGTKEWAQYDFEKLQKVSSVEVYWWDERRIKAHCRVPQSWRLLYRQGDSWKPVTSKSEFCTEMDQFNRVTFEAVETTALRIEVDLQPEWSGGILEWKVE